ncbi:glycosyltransferase family 2 protein, partial [Acidobacteria bacterium AH-259-D05]|nr:glycosyltransferase family 2 protein [Acidobacteria bacterium AH-259-D05]
EGMKQIMSQIEESWCDQILVVDGGSTDGTVEYAKEHGYNVILQQRPGLMNAYREAFPHIQGDIVIPFSPDGNSPVEVIPQLIEKMKEGYDMVIASRYLPGATSDDDTRITALGNWVFTKLINLLFGGRYTDAMIMYRAFRKSLYQELGLLEDRYLEEKFSETICSIPLISMRAAKKKIRITEIPGDEPARIGGAGKCRHFVWGSIYLLQMVQEFLYWECPTGERTNKK